MADPKSTFRELKKLGSVTEIGEYLGVHLVFIWNGYYSGGDYFTLYPKSGCGYRVRREKMRLHVRDLERR